MKAILINSLKCGGAERIALNIFNSLSEQGGENVLLIVLKKSNKQYSIDYSNIIYLSTNSDLDRGLSLSKLFAYPLLLFRFVNVVKKENIKVVQSHLFTSSIINVISKIFCSKHQVQIVNHMLVSYENTAGFIGRLKIFFIRFTYKRADVLISISQKMKIDIDNLILKGKGILHIVIPNPHDIEYIISLSNEEAINFNFDKKKKYIITVGRLVKRKRIDHLIEAFSFVSQHNPDCELIITGDGEEKESLINLASRLKIDRVVHFLGFVDNPFKIMKRSDIFVMSSESEGLPNAIIEALICKLPIISTDCPTGPREILAPDTNINIQLKNTNEEAMYGYLTPVNNPVKLAEAIVWVLNDYQNYRQKALVGFNNAQKYATGNIINQYKQILNLDAS